MTQELQFPTDITRDEIYFIDFVKQSMLRKLSDRRKFLFVYCFELGHSQKEVAQVLNVNETNISRQFKRIREILSPFREGYVNKNALSK